MVGLLAALLHADPGTLIDLEGPEYTPPETPFWLREVKPDWIRPFEGINGTPDAWRPRGHVLGRDVKGADRWMANHYLFYRPETAAYLYTAYTPPTVAYSERPASDV